MRILAALLLFLGGAICGAGVVWFKVRPGSASQHRLETIIRMREEENMRLHGLVEASGKAKALAALQTERAAIEKQVAEITGLPFLHPVDYDVVTRKEIKSVLARKLAQTFSEKEFAQMAAALSRLGLIPEHYPLREKYIDLIGEQVAAFYDQHEHKLFMFENAALDQAQNRIVLAHELTHALQDQHFNLTRLPLEIKDNDDRSEAASALVEGEATVVMGEYMLKNMSLKALKENLTSSFSQNMDQLQKAPKFLQEVLIFPYMRGQEFCGAVMAAGGYEALSRAFANPPRSTAQILHPEKYMANPPEEPLAIAWPETTLKGEAAGADNTVGELAMRIQLSPAIDARVAEQIAAGWRGDRYLAFQNGGALVWKTEWASPDDAAQFFNAETQVIEKRYHPAQPRKSDRRYEADAPRALRLMRAMENAVLLIDADSPAIALEIEERFGK